MKTPLFAENPIPMWIMTMDSLSILEVNRAATEFYGYSRQEFLQKKFRDLQSRANLTSLFEDQIISSTQFKHIGNIDLEDKWGDIHSVKLSGCSIKYKGQKAYLIRAIHWDSLNSSNGINKETYSKFKIRQENHLLDLLDDIRDNFVHFDQSKDALEESLKNICEFINWPFAHVYVFDEQSQHLESANIWHSKTSNAAKFINEILNTTFKPNEGLVGKVYFEETPHWIEGIHQTPNFKRRKSIAEVFESCISIPIKGEPSAVIEFYHEDSIKKDQQILRYLTVIGKQLGHQLERKKFQQEVTNHKRKLQYLAENATDKVAIYDSNANCIYTSPSTKSLLGYTPEEYIEKNIINLVHPDDRPAIEENLSALLKGGAKELITFRLQHKDGHYIWFECNVNPVYDNKGNLEEIHTAARDIRDRIEYERELRREKEFIERAINSLPGLFYTLDKNGNLVRFNKGFTEELGYTEEEVKRMSALDFHYEENKQRISETIEQAFTEGVTTTVAKLEQKNGGARWYHLTGSHFQQDGDEYVIGMGIDISKRIQTEQQLEYQSSLLSNLFKNAPIGIAMVDDNSDILNVNSSFEDIFGYPAEQIKGKNIDDLITPEEYKIEQKELFLEQQRKGKGSFQYESIRLRSDGTEVPVLIGIVPVAVSEETTLGYAIYVDITERKSYLEKIKQSLKEKRILLQEIHHRVKNNLAVVSSFLQLQKLNTDNEKLQLILSDSERRIQMMAQVHEQLYNTESLSEIHFANYIRKLVGSVKNMYDSDDSITFSITCEDIDLNINQAIPCAMILNELISNSFKHAFKETEKGEIKINVTNHNGTIKMLIQDNGSGQPPESNSQNTSSLGYTIINTLVKQLEADIHVESKNGMKVTITFEQEEIKGSNSAIIKNSFK